MMTRTFLPPGAAGLVLLVLAAAALDGRGRGLADERAPAATRVLDVRDLLRWDFRIAPDRRPLLAVIRERAPRDVELELAYATLVYRADDAQHEAVARALADLRDEAGRRELERAEANLASLASDYRSGEHGGTFVKLTWTGPQSEPVPGLAIHSTTRIFDAVPFRAFRRQGIHYGNDDIGVFYSFAATPEEMDRLVQAIVTAPFAKEAAKRTEALTVSLSLIDTWSPRRPNYVEMQLGEGGAILDRIDAAVGETNPTARAVIRDYRRSIGG